jgi:hypothetical protein
MSEKTYILTPSAEIYYKQAAAYRASNSDAIINFQKSSTKEILTGRDASVAGIYSAVPSSVSVVQVKLPEYASLKDIKKIKISG